MVERTHLHPRVQFFWPLSHLIPRRGNYGEMFERDLGSGSVMKLARGLNNLWTQGGLMYALPIR